MSCPHNNEHLHSGMVGHDARGARSVMSCLHNGHRHGFMVAKVCRSKDEQTVRAG